MGLQNIPQCAVTSVVTWSLSGVDGLSPGSGTWLRVSCDWGLTAFVKSVFTDPARLPQALIHSDSSSEAYTISPLSEKKETTSMMMNLYWAAERFLCPQTITCDPTVMWEKESCFFLPMWQRWKQTQKKHDMSFYNRTAGQRKRSSRTTDFSKLTGQSHWITSENHSMTWDYSADSFCVATIIKFYDLLKLNRQGRRLAAHASRR